MGSKRISLIVLGLLVLAVSAVIASQCFRSAPKPPPAAPGAQAVKSVYEYEVVREYPHDTQAFTQGLTFLDGCLYEGTGRTRPRELSRVRRGILANMSIMLQSNQDAAQSSEAIESPEWHKQILDGRQQRVVDGAAEFEDWEKAKIKIRERVR